MEENLRSKSIGLACSGKEIYHFCFVLLLRANSKYGGFFVLRFGGAYIWRGLYMEVLIFEIYWYVMTELRA